MPKVKASELQTNVQITTRGEDGSVKDNGWYGPDYPDRANETVELAEEHPALVRQRLSDEDVELLRRQAELREYAAARGVPVGGDGRQYATDYGVPDGEVPNKREAELAGQVKAGVAALPRLPDGWEKAEVGELRGMAAGRGVTIAPNAKKDDIVEQLRSTQR